MKKFSDFVKEEFILEMARVGYLDNKLEIYIHTNDPGNIPHFHIRDIQTRGNNFHTCIEIKTNKYFHHTGKEDILNSHQRNSLYDFLKSNDKYGEKNWQVLIKEWNRNNSDTEIPINLDMPDYRNIEENK
ncbi:MAG: hypothetical protein J1F35_06725 [Erysipelotrichales bacterium]|nr:hypothetical protein [Erysipelotrichales bacterium]